MNGASSLPDVVTLANRALKIEVARLGAELVRLRDCDGQDYLWNGDPVHWKGRAPLLFPMVGRAVRDHIRVDGSHYPLLQHGFARTSQFEIIKATSTQCTMRLASSDQTIFAYPFTFCLLVSYELQDSALTLSATVKNSGQRHLPFAFGFHPAFRWPLPGGRNETHEIVFAQPESKPIRLLKDGLLRPKSYPSPVSGQRLVLNGALFEEGALIFDQPSSRAVAYRTIGGPVIEISFPDMPHLGLWTKPGAPFLCIEPWQGFASPEGYDGEFTDRPGVISISPGTERVFNITINLRPISNTGTS